MKHATPIDVSGLLNGSASASTSDACIARAVKRHFHHDKGNMHIPFKLRTLLVASSAAFCLLLLGAERASAQKIDLNVNGMSDVWEWIYGATGLTPGGDADGDGATNALESIAGTNPFDPNSAPRITGLSRTATNFTVSMSCVLGKQYVLQSVSDLSDTNLAN